jgi:putative NADH-flavin reductase
MKMVVFGATGGAGQALVTAALAAGNEVTAVARKPSTITTRHERLRVVAGDVADAASVAEATRGQEGVVLTVGPRPGTPPGTLISDATRAVLAGMKQHGAQRLVLVSGLMVGEARGMGLVGRLAVAFFRRLNHALYRDKLLAEQLVLASDCAWSIVRPPLFGEAAVRGTFRLGVDLDVKSGKMANADVAAAVLAALTDATYTHKSLELSY